MRNLDAATRITFTQPSIRPFSLAIDLISIVGEQQSSKWHYAFALGSIFFVTVRNSARDVESLCTEAC